jgi:5'-methylthioinosine phosphorylase
VFLPRHGLGHHIPPHRINYRANIWALKSMGVEQIIGVGAVGGISAALGDGDIILPDQLIDYTHTREHTFFDGESGEVQHIDFSYPYDKAMVQNLLAAGNNIAGLRLHKTGVYAATQGPRLETAAEINRIERDGGTVVGMTGMPEAALAREAGLGYASVALVVNAAAGRSDAEISIAEINQNLETGMQQVIKLLLAYFGCE